MQFNKEDIQQLDKKYRLNLINSISGIKPANLIGTRSKDKLDNLAIFSSVFHLGSNPAQFGLIIRPQSKTPRDTYANIQETKYYTINHVAESFIKKAHYTSAKLNKEDSEFDVMKIEREFIDGFHAPFVKKSKVKIGLKKSDNILLPNGCTLIIGNVELVVFPENSINELGQIDLESYSCAGISGLNTYYGLKKLNSYPYVRNDEIPDFE